MNRREKAGGQPGVDPKVVAAVRRRDQQWFNAHPGRTWYIRRARDGETASRPRWMAVIQITPGWRQRAPLYEHLSDATVDHMMAHGTVELTGAGPVWFPDTNNSVDSEVPPWFSPQDTAQLSSILENPSQHGVSRCCLCEARAAFVGTFCPTESDAQPIGRRAGRSFVRSQALRQLQDAHVPLGFDLLLRHLPPRVHRLVARGPAALCGDRQRALRPHFEQAEVTLKHGSDAGCVPDSRHFRGRLAAASLKVPDDDRRPSQRHDGVGDEIARLIDAAPALYADQCGV